MNDKFLTPEEWLKANCYPSDLSFDGDNIADFISSNNLVGSDGYMQKYVDYVKEYERILEME